MVAVPAARPDTTPVLLFTVATPVLLDDQAPPVFPLEVKVVVPPIQMFCVPLKVPALGGAVTVTVRVAVALAQPPVPITVYVMVTVPAAIPEMAPVLLLIVAMTELLVVQLPLLPLEEKVVEPPTQMFCVPLSVPAFGAAVTVTTCVLVTGPHPAALAKIVVVPLHPAA